MLRLALAILGCCHLVFGANIRFRKGGVNQDFNWALQAAFNGRVKRSPQQPDIGPNQGMAILPMVPPIFGPPPPQPCNGPQCGPQAPVIGPPVSPNGQQIPVPNGQPIFPVLKGPGQYPVPLPQQYPPPPKPQQYPPLPQQYPIPPKSQQYPSPPVPQQYPQPPKPQQYPQTSNSNIGDIQNLEKDADQLLKAIEDRYNQELKKLQIIDKKLHELNRANERDLQNVVQNTRKMYGKQVNQETNSYHNQVIPKYPANTKKYSQQSQRQIYKSEATNSYNSMKDILGHPPKPKASYTSEDFKYKPLFSNKPSYEPNLPKKNLGEELTSILEKVALDKKQNPQNERVVEAKEESEIKVLPIEPEATKGTTTDNNLALAVTEKTTLLTTTTAVKEDSNLKVVEKVKVDGNPPATTSSVDLPKDVSKNDAPDKVKESDEVLEDLSKLPSEALAMANNDLEDLSKLPVEALAMAQNDFSLLD